MTNYGYNRLVIARGLDATRRYSLEEIANGIGIPPSYLEDILLRQGDDFGDAFIDQLAQAAGTTVKKIIRAGK